MAAEIIIESARAGIPARAGRGPVMDAERVNRETLTNLIIELQALKNKADERIRWLSESSNLNKDRRSTEIRIKKAEITELAAFIKMLLIRRGDQ